MTERDLFYLRSIQRQLRELRLTQKGHSLGGEVLADNLDWLDCFIEQHERANARPPAFTVTEWIPFLSRAGRFAMVRLPYEVWDFAHLTNHPVMLDGVAGYTCRGVERFAHMPPYRAGEVVGLLILDAEAPPSAPVAS